MTMLEQYLGGWIIYSLKRSLFIFTDRRVFHVPTKPNFTYRRSITHFLYTDCKSIRISGRTLVVKYHQGRADKGGDELVYFCRTAEEELPYYRHYGSGDHAALVHPAADPHDPSNPPCRFHLRTSGRTSSRSPVRRSV